MRNCLSAFLLTAALGGFVFTEAVQTSSHRRSQAGGSNLCRCEAEWENFYDRRQRERDLQTKDGAGFYIVDGIKVIPCNEGASEKFVANPASVQLAANIFEDSDAGRRLRKKKSKSKSSKRQMSKASKSESSKSGSSKSVTSEKYGDKTDTGKSSKSAKSGKVRMNAQYA